MPRFGIVYKDRGETFTPEKGEVYSVKSLTVDSKGKPVRLFFYTWNNVIRRFQHWGYSDENVTLPYSSGDLPPSLEGHWAWGDRVPRGGSDDPAITDWVDPANVPNPPKTPAIQDIYGPPEAVGANEEWPWWMPDGCRIMYSGNKEDHLFTNPTEDGNLGIRQGGYIDATWDIGESVGRHEVFLGCQIPEFGAQHGGVPSAYWDIAGRVGYNWWFHEGQGLQVALSPSMNFQWTNDDTAGNQSNPSGETWDAHHVNLKAGITVKWDNGSFFGFSDADFIITVDMDMTGDIYAGVGVQL